MAAPKEIQKKKIHITLQAKGGVGKSFISSLLAQYLYKKNDNVIPIDTDPNNKTLHSITALKSKSLKLLDENEKVDERAFDRLVDTIFDEKNQDKDFIIDSGATTFIPLVNYLVDNQVIPLFSNKFDVYIHIPVSGGQSYEDTLKGMQQIISSFKNSATYIVWINEYHGTVKNFETSKEYQEVKKDIKAIIFLSSVNENTFGKDLEDMTKKRVTFEEVMQDDSFSFMAKHRLLTYSKIVYEQLDSIL